MKRIPALCCFMCSFAVSFVNAKPYLPEHDDQVLQRLSASRAQVTLQQAPTNLAQSVEQAWQWIALGREQSQPRYYGYAQALLEPWWQSDIPQILLLRATLRQNQHHFDAALIDLDKLLAQQPRNAQAWLTRAVILTVTGKPDQAMRSCQPLMRLSSRLLAATCLGNALSLMGQGEKAYHMIHTALESRLNDGNIATELWAYTVLAEISVREGKTDLAQTHFQQALELATKQRQRDSYLLAAFADFLLEQGKFQQVRDLLANETQLDALLLRLTLAEHALATGREQQLADEFEARLQAVRARGEASHLGDGARFMLVLRQQVDKALVLAQANWAKQRDPAAALLLVQTAMAAKQSAPINSIRNWLQKTGLQDVRLQTLLQAAADRESSA